MISRLRKIAFHDVHNRDTAILYVNGNFYEDATHALCAKQFADENNYDDTVDALQYRPSTDYFTDLSNEFGTVVLAHRVDKENAVYLIYGIVDGQIVEFSGIPQNIISEFENHYNMPTKDEMLHDEDAENQYNEDEQWEKTRNRIDEVGTAKQIVEQLKQQYGFKGNASNNQYIDNGAIMIKPGSDAEGTRAIVGVLGDRKQFVDNEDLIDYIENVDTSYYDYIIQLNGTVTVEPPVFYIEIPNIDGDIIELGFTMTTNKMRMYNYKDFNIDSSIKQTNIKFTDIKKLINSKHK